MQNNVEETQKCLYINTVQNRESFLMQRDGALHPIEVKAEGNVRSNSLTTLLRNNPSLQAERYSMQPYIEQESMTSVPLYAV